jgi:hypothetical protein
MRIIKSLFVVTVLAFSPLMFLQAQNTEQSNTTSDTSMYADAYFVLNSITITPNTVFEMDIEAARERSRWRYRTLKVYPYAVRAVELMEEINVASKEMDRKKDVRKYKKKLEQELKDSFKDEVKGLSKTQGKLLIDMIERQTDRTFYSILKDLKSGTTAFFWQGFGKAYGYDLKEGYQPESNPILEDILNDMEWPTYSN